MDNRTRQGKEQIIWNQIRMERKEEMSEREITEVIGFEEFILEIQRAIRKQASLINIYQELIDTNANPKREEEYIDQKILYEDMIDYNLGLVNRAEIEKDYLLFYKDRDGVPGMFVVNEETRKNLMYIDRFRKRCIA